MHYEINVSFNGTHFFATHERSIKTEMTLKKMINVFKERFPESEGYSISVTKWETVGKTVDLDRLYKGERC